MRALAITPRQANTARLVDVPLPEIEPGRVLVRVIRVGLCGTDRELVAGRIGQAPLGSDFLILGHESLGRVEVVGEGVDGFSPGDYVVASVRRPDNCPNCRAGESDMCLEGNFIERGIKGAHGYLTEYYTEAPQFLVAVPPELKAVAVLMEPLSVVEKAVRQVFEIQERLRWQPQRAVILGAGAIGLLATALLRLRDLETFTLARSAPGCPACAVIELMGGTYWSTAEHPVGDLSQELGNIDIIVEATGNTQMATAAAECLGINGVLCLTGMYTGDHQQLMPMDKLYLEMVQGNKVYLGSVNAHRRDFQAGIEHLAQMESRWPGLLARAITRRFPLEQFAQALERPRGDIKTVIEISPTD